jgi:hypothetical protein
MLEANVEANAALRHIARREDSHNLDQHVAQLMKAEGVAEPTPEQRQHFDRKRKKSLSNQDCVNPHVTTARITKMKNGRTRPGLQGRAGSGSERRGGRGAGHPAREPSRY